MGTIVGLDLETTGLEPDYHHIWEIGAIVRDHRDPTYDGTWHILMRPNLANADPHALRIGRYYERAPRFVSSDPNKPAGYIVECPPGLAASLGETSRTAIARHLAILLDGASVIGINPQFDCQFLARFLRGNCQSPTWNHRLVDVVPLAAGFVAGARSGYNFAAQYLHDWHNGAAADGCRVPAPDLDQTELPAPAWSASDLGERLGVKAPDDADRHTALGDARWALAIYDRVMTP